MFYWYLRLASPLPSNNMLFYLSVPGLDICAKISVTSISCHPGYPKKGNIFKTETFFRTKLIFYLKRKLKKSLVSKKLPKNRQLFIKSPDIEIKRTLIRIQKTGRYTALIPPS